MAEKNSRGFITLDRTIMKWRWYKVPATAHLFVHLILQANHEDRDVHGITVHRGELLTSISRLSQETGLSFSQVRTGLKHLILTGEVTDCASGTGRLIFIPNYDFYQTAFAGRMTDRSQSDRKPIAMRSQQTNNYNNENNENNEKNIYIVSPSVEEVEEFVRSEGLTLDARDFVDYNSARGWKNIMDWKPLARLRARHLAEKGEADAPAEELDVWGKPIRKEYV